MTSHRPVAYYEREVEMLRRAGGSLPIGGWNGSIAGGPPVLHTLTAAAMERHGLVDYDRTARVVRLRAAA